MYELMFDLETLDTKPSAVVLSIGAVIWKKEIDEFGTEIWLPESRFMRVLDIQEQLDRGRTVSQSTLLWWQWQNSIAKEEAFNPVRRPVKEVLADFRDFIALSNNNSDADPDGITAFWASPATFDFPIWEDLAMTFTSYVPWTYRQKYDVRTVVRTANYSTKDHVASIDGVAHTPVYDCRWQIDVLTAARNKLRNRQDG